MIWGGVCAGVLVLALAVGSASGFSSDSLTGSASLLVAIAAGLVEATLVVGCSRADRGYETGSRASSAPRRSALAAAPISVEQAHGPHADRACAALRPGFAPRALRSSMWIIGSSPRPPVARVISSARARSSSILSPPGPVVVEQRRGEALACKSLIRRLAACPGTTPAPARSGRRPRSTSPAPMYAWPRKFRRQLSASAAVRFSVAIACDRSRASIAGPSSPGGSPPLPATATTRPARTSRRCGRRSRPSGARARALLRSSP